MRCLFRLLCLTTFAVSAPAQEQESKLADRLLRPDMSLANPAQNKKFSAVGQTSVDRKFAAKSFSTGTEQSVATFGGTKGFFSRVFGTLTFARSGAARAESSADVADAKKEFTTNASSLTRAASDSEKKVTVREYAEKRPFLGKGTRQKILSQENKPLTIDEVRELLNRSK